MTLTPTRSAPQAGTADGAHALPRTALPEAALPKPALPEAALPGAALPEAALPEAALPEAALPEAALPEAELVRRYRPLVERIARRQADGLPDSIAVEDLVQAGMLGLLEASRRFDPDHGTPFEGYAATRIRGAMIDELRPADWVPRSVRRQGRELAAAVRRIEHRTGAPAGNADLMAELGVDAHALHRTLRDVSRGRLLSFEELTESGATGDMTLDHEAADQELLRERFAAALSAAIGTLPLREQEVLALYYQEELNLREVGEVMGVSESRISQIHGRAVVQLRARLDEWLDGGVDPSRLGERVDRPVDAAGLPRHEGRSPT
jgi:RNA polymerase sigma factor for flagellar operon FliA